MKWKIFDVIGPIMVGPSSSHTSGAVKLGLFCNKLIGGIPDSADIYLHGSYADVYKGHGTDLALVAGLLGFAPDSEKVVEAFNEAKKIGMKYKIIPTDLGEKYHPNTAKFVIKKGDLDIEIIGISIGGGKIEIAEINGMSIEGLDGDNPTLLVFQNDRPGVVAHITDVISKNNINIGTLHIFREQKGGKAMTIATLDSELDTSIVSIIENIDNVLKATFLHSLES